VRQRTHNERNDISQWIYKSQYLLLSYGDEGNLLRCFIGQADGAFSFVYDGWNPLVAVKDDSTEVGRCEREDLGHM